METSKSILRNNNYKIPGYFYRLILNIFYDTSNGPVEVRPEDVLAIEHSEERNRLYFDVDRNCFMLNPYVEVGYITPNPNEETVSPLGTITENSNNIEQDKVELVLGH